MAVMNPCCCSLQTGTILVACFNICLSLLFLIYHLTITVFGISVGVAISSSKSSKSDEHYDSYGHPKSGHRGVDDSEVAVAALVSLIFAIFITVMFVVNIIFSIVLLVGANQRNVSKCRAWFVVTTTFLVLYILYKVGMFIVVTVVAGVIAGLVTILIEVVFVLIFVLATAYQLWVVYAFTDQLKREGEGTSPPYPGVVYSVTPKHDNQPPMHPHPHMLPRVDFGSPPPPYAPTTAPYAPGEPAPQRSYNPASVGYPVLPVLKHNN